MTARNSSIRRRAAIALALVAVALVGAGTAAGIVEVGRDPHATGVAAGDRVRFDLTVYTPAGVVVETTLPQLAQAEIDAGNPFFPVEFNESGHLPIVGRVVLRDAAPGGPAPVARYLLGARPGEVVRTPPIAMAYGEPKTFTFSDTIGPIRDEWTVDLDRLERPDKRDATLATYGDTTQWREGQTFLFAGTLNASVVSLEGREAKLRVDAQTGDRVHSRTLGLDLAVERQPDGHLMLRTLLAEGDVFAAYDCKTLPLPIENGRWRVTAVRDGLVSIEPDFTPEQHARYVEPLVFEMTVLDVEKASPAARLRALASSSFR